MGERVVVLDFGGQYNQLIARRVREAGVFCELLPCSAEQSRIMGNELSAIILTGGPDSVYAENARTTLPEVFTLGVPVLGICYGMQYIAKEFDGKIDRAAVSEFGRTETHFESHPLFDGIDDGIVWMNHNDSVVCAPEGFSVIATTKNCPVAAFADDKRKVYGVQFHAEVNHTIGGAKMIANFLSKVCGLSCTWKPEGLIDELVQQIRDKVGDKRVIGGLSGGVDSTVATVLAYKAIGDQLTCVFVDHGLMRQNEAEEVKSFYDAFMPGLKVIYVNAKDRYMKKLAGVDDPEKKRVIIGNEFINVFTKEAKKIGGADFLLQGTIYPDVIESGGDGGAAVIKKHHNVGGLPEKMGLSVVEPLRSLFKDEVRALGEALGIPHHLVWRQPFPGPGIAIRIIGSITDERIEIVRHSDAILRDEIKKAGLEEAIWQYFTVFTGARSVGVMGDNRTYDYTVAVRAVESTDAMTVEWAKIPYTVLERISERIIAEVSHVNRVVYDITSKPPGTIEWE